jgi:hypothetical protein
MLYWLQCKFIIKILSILGYFIMKVLGSRKETANEGHYLTQQLTVNTIFTFSHNQTSKYYLKLLAFVIIIIIIYF